MTNSSLIKTFFGIRKFKSDLFIITNINDFFSEITKKYFRENGNNGWWKEARIEINNRIVEVLKIPPGNNILDCLQVIKTKAKEIFFMGYCGGLKYDAKIGDIVCPRFLINGNKRIENLCPDSRGIIFQTNGLIHKKSFFIDLAKKGVDFLDMESYSIFDFGRKNKIKVNLFMVVSDLPLKKAFYFVDDEDKKTVKRGIRKAAGLLSQYVNNRSLQELAKIRTIVDNYFYYQKRKPNNKESHNLENLFIKIYKKSLDYQINQNAPFFLHNFKDPGKKFVETVSSKKECLALLENILSNLGFRKILIKPNLVSVESYPETSDLHLLQNIIKILRKKSPMTTITVADGPSIFFDDQQIFQKEIIKRLKKKGIQVINVLREKFYQRRTKGKIINYLNIPKFIEDYDYLINLSCFKEHNRAGISSATKNLMGLLPNFERLRFHKTKKGIAKAIKDLGTIFGSNLIIIDARKILRKAQQKIYDGIPSKGFGIIISNDLVLAEKTALNLYNKNVNS